MREYHSFPEPVRWRCHRFDDDSPPHRADLEALDGRCGTEPDGPPEGDRWSTWTGADHGPEPRPGWVITEHAAVDTELASFGAFQIDMARGEIAFSKSKNALTNTTYGFALLGSWLEDTKRFMWGWANEQVATGVRADVDKIRLASTEAGLRALTEPSFGCPEPCADRLSRHAAARIDNCAGVYRAPFKTSQGKGVMYLALKRPS